MGLSRLKKIFIILMAFVTLTAQFSPLLNLATAKADEVASDPIEWVPGNGAGAVDSGDNWEPTDADILEFQSRVPDSITAFADPVLGIGTSNNTTNPNPVSTAYNNLFKSNGAKIIFKPSDAEEVRELTCMRDVIPNYEDDIVAIIQDRPDLTYATVTDMKANHSDAFTALVNQLKSQKASSLQSQLLLPQYRTQLACVLQDDSVQQAEQDIQDDPTFVNARISTAIDSLKIDARVLKMLMYLVTPKDQGGAGHDLIKVYRLRQGFNIPTRTMDTESQAIIDAKNQAAADASQSSASNSSTNDPTIGDTTESAAQQAATASGQVIDNKTTSSNTSSTSGAASSTGTSATASTNTTTSDFAVGIDDSENQVISAHAEGEAVDIEAVDNIRCTLIQKRRVGSDKKTMEPAKPIELQWQTDEGYSASPEGQNDTIANMANSLYRNGLMDLMNQFDLNINNIDDLSTANLGDVMDTVGKALIGQLIDTNGDITGSDLKETLKKVGAVYLADQLQLPRAALYGTGYSNLDDLKANLGRATLEQALGMPFGSLIGETPAQIFYSIGERKMETQLNLPIATLTPDITNEKQLLIKIGSSLVEDKLNVTRGSFLNPKLGDIKKAVGDLKFNTLYSMPQVIDTRLGMDSAGNLSQQFASGSLSPSDYLYAIAAKHLADNAYMWTAYKNSSLTPGSLPTSASGVSQWDTIFNLPQHTTLNSAPLMDNLLTGQMMASLPDIGKDELAKKLTNRTEEQTVIKDWINTANSATATVSGRNQPACPAAQPMSENVNINGKSTLVTVDEKYLNSRLGLQDGDLYQIFGCSLGGGGAVFSNIGATRLYNAVKNSPEATKEKDQYLADHPEVVALIQEVDFYKSRMDDINRHLDTLDKLMDTLKSDPDTKDTYASYAAMRDKIRNHSGTSVADYQALAKEAKTQFGILRSKAATSDKFKTIVNSCLTEIDAIFFDLQEMITGTDNGRLSDFRFSELTINDTSGGSGNTNKMSVKRAVWLLLTGKASVQDVIIYMGGSMIEDKLNLPPNTFFYFVKSLDAANSAKPDQSNLWDSTAASDINYPLGSDSQTGADNSASFNTAYLNSLGGSAAQQPADKNHDRERFMAALGQAALEEQMTLQPVSFQGTTVADPNNPNQNIGDVIANMASGSTVANAKAKLQSGFGTGVSLDRLISGDTSAWSQARASFQSFDHTLNLPSGTTEAFLTGTNQRLAAGAYLSQDEMDLLSAKLGIAEPALTKLTQVLAGNESWQMSDITLQNFNPYTAAANTSTGTNCIQNNDGKITYTDMDGAHIFATQELAYAYYQAHSDRYLDYVSQIIQGISGATGGNLTANLKSNLTAYLGNLNTTAAFDTGTLQAIADMSGAPIEILQRLFTRTANKSNLFNYLETVGQSVSQQRLRYALLNTFGVTLGGTKFTGNDLFDILNGGSTNVLYKAAGSFLDSEVGVDQGTFAKILAAPNSDARNCLLEQAGASLIFKRLGISGLDFNGNPYTNLGSDRIETALGWPKGSFDSDSPKTGEDKTSGLVALINKVGVNAFVKGFSIPLAGLDFRTPAKALFPADKATDIDKLSNQQILDRLDQVQSGIPLNDPQMISIKTARDQLTALVVKRLGYIQDPNSPAWTFKDTGSAMNLPNTLPDFTVDESDILLGQMVAAATFKAEILTFQKRTSALDFQLQLSSGTDSMTKKLLLGTITPNVYRDAVSLQQATILGAGAIGAMLGIDPAKTQAAEAAFLTLKTKGKNLNDQDKVNLFQAFETIFGLDLDESAGFREGTFQKIIAHPENARNTLIREGLYRLDQSIFGADNPAKVSTEAIFAAYIGADDAGVYQTCQIGDTTINSVLGLHGEMVTKCKPVKETGSSGAKEAAAQQMSAYLLQQACPNGAIKGACWLLDHPSATVNGVNVSTTDLLSQFLVTGDVNVLAAIANSALAYKINTVLDSQLHLSFLPAGFQVTWEDIVGATYGNRGLEDTAAQDASYQALEEIQDPKLAATIANESTDYARDGGYGVEGQVNIGDSTNPYTSSAVTQNTSYSIGTMVNQNIAHAYGAFDPAKYQALLLQYNINNPPQPESDWVDSQGTVHNYLDAQGAPTLQYYSDLDVWTLRESAVVMAQANARDRVRKDYQKNLEYHYYDSILYQKDPNIPPGFAAAMFEGNAHTRANALAAWLQNGVKNGSFLGINIPDYAKIPLLYLSNAAVDGGQTAFQNFVSSGAINQFDTMLCQKFNDVIGISFASGTFTAVIAGMKNGGDFTKGFTVGKTTLPSLETVYKQAFAERISGWVDRELGFQVGTAYKIYSSYKSYEAARSAYSASIVYTAAAQNGLQMAQGNLDYLNNQIEMGVHVDPVTLQKAKQEVTDQTTNASNKLTAQKQSQIKMTQLKADLVTFIISSVFAKQLAQLEQAIGLVPGSGAMLVGMAVSWYFGLAFSPWTIGLFIVMNLFGYYKTELLCTADGYYPEVTAPPSGSVADNGGLGVFDGMDATAKKTAYVQAAQYKARILLGDALNMPAKFADQRMTPSQIMTGRKEDVDYWYPKTLDVIYKYTGAPDANGNLPSRAGLWQNPQTTAYTHIGF